MHHASRLRERGKVSQVFATSNAGKAKLRIDSAAPRGTHQESEVEPVTETSVRSFPSHKSPTRQTSLGFPNLPPRIRCFGSRPPRQPKNFRGKFRPQDPRRTTHRCH